MSFNVAEFLFDTPLYKKVKLNENSVSEDLSKLNKSSRINIKGYNPIEKVNTTYNVVSNFYFYNNPLLVDTSGTRTIQIECKQYGSTFSFFIHYNSETKELVKFGQFPSVADFHKHELKKYRKVLGEQSSNEFSRAIGLAANGIGIGSFVYLRRVFEKFIIEAIKVSVDAGATKEVDFFNKRMDEKIKHLNGYLPEFLVENGSMYSILSKGVHELDEQTCLDYFKVLRDGIIIILDEKLEKLNKEKRIIESKKAIDHVNSILQNKKENL